jgi:hypothetical protein
MNTERRFHIEQDRTYSGEWINDDTKWANTKVNMVSTYTVYESVGTPSYQTPVFTGTKSECKNWVNEAVK